MARAFTVAALAIAEGGANAVGALRLTCADEELDVELVRVAGYTDGFALGAVAEPVRFGVPYKAVRGLFRRGRALCIALDPSVCGPFNRFALARFEGDAPVGQDGSGLAVHAMARAYQARVRARLASWIVPGPLGALVALGAPDDLVSGPLGVASLWLVAALAAWLALRWGARAVTWGGPPSDRLRDALEAELLRRMGFAPDHATSLEQDCPAPAAGDVVGATRQDDPAPAAGAIRLDGAVARPGAVAPTPRGLAPVASLPLRAPLLTASAVAVAGIVGIMAFVQRFSAPVDTGPLLPELRRLAPAVAALDAPHLAREVRKAADPELPRCLCQRADSPLWKDGVPILSVLGASGPEDGSAVISPELDRGDEGDPERGASTQAEEGASDAPLLRGHYDVDVAVVNNGAAPLYDVRVVLTFARRDRQGERAGITERGLFWEGALGPGRAVKWHVEAPGTEVKIEPSVAGILEGEAVPAEADAFFALTRARYRVVRIHATTMLAYHRDPRVHEALLALGPGSSTEERTMARIRRAASDAIPCALAVEDGKLRACLFNASAKPWRGASLREIPEQPGAPARRWAIAATLPVHDGVEVMLPLEGAAAPAELAIEPAERDQGMAQTK